MSIFKSLLDKLNELKDVLEELETSDPWAHDFVESLAILVEEDPHLVLTVSQIDKLGEIYENHIRGNHG